MTGLDHLPSISESWVRRRILRRCFGSHRLACCHEASVPEHRPSSGRPVHGPARGRDRIDKRPVGGPVRVAAPGPRGSARAASPETRCATCAITAGTTRRCTRSHAEDLDDWGRELGRPVASSAFGRPDNPGARHLQARIGERWRVGSEVVLEVACRGDPCRTFQGHVGEQHWVKRFTQKGAPGAYLRVIEPGEIRAGDPIEVVHRPDHEVTVALAFRAETTERALPERGRWRGGALPAVAMAEEKIATWHGTAASRSERGRGAGARGGASGACGNSWSKMGVGWRARGAAGQVTTAWAMTTALITGSTAGIGAAFARRLAADGHNLVLVARDTERLGEQATELHDRHGLEAEVLTADLSTDEGIDAVAARLSDRKNPVDLLINNAGFGNKGHYLEVSMADELTMLKVHCEAVLRLTSAATEAMRERGRGGVVNVASVAAFVPRGTYGASKAWVVQFTQGAARDLAGSGVRLMALAPGFVRTEFHQRAGMGTDNIPNWMWLDADKLVAAALADLARGKSLSIPTPATRR